ANDTWRGHWYGAEKRTLIEQTYPGPADHERHFYAMLEAFQDPRYIRVHDRPLFTIFRPKNLPNPEAFIDQWQTLAAKNGLPGIHFVAHLFDDELDYPWREIGYGGAVMTNELKLLRRRLWHVAQERYRRNGVADAVQSIGRLMTHRLFQRVLRWPGNVHAYRDAMLFFKSQAALDLGCYPSVVPGWDNTARAGPKGVVLHGATPQLFAEHLRDVLDSVADRPAEDRIVFVKSWNEWAEGNYLEPDRKFGHGYLDAVRAALQSAATPRPELIAAS
ncbi:MAG TPA: glycoside hydrolase family 99-like domain-containing protein, partial [Opitutaceae bacterium]|nr:glycoside hydrolase family 99-like domain-containing protein [Opitutaceae bacterium]